MPLPKEPVAEPVTFSFPDAKTVTLEGLTGSKAAQK